MIDYSRKGCVELEGHVTSLNFAEIFGTRKLWISYGIVCVILGLVVLLLIEHRLVSCDRQIDGRTGRRTHDDGKYRASRVARVKWGGLG